MNLSEHFTLEELEKSTKASYYGITNKADENAIANLRLLVDHILEPAREQLKLPIKVNSGFRSARVNELVGGAKNSNHMRGQAADITCENNARLLAILQTLPCHELIVYRKKGNPDNILWIHVAYAPQMMSQRRSSVYVR